MGQSEEVRLPLFHRGTTMITEAIAARRTTNFAVPVQMPRQVDNDRHLVKLWLHGRPHTTLVVYSERVDEFLAFLGGKPLQFVTLGDLQDFADTLSQLAPSSQVTVLSAIRSLFSFGHKLGYLPVNVAAVLEMPRVQDTLHTRYLSEEEVQRILALEEDPRNHAVLVLLYFGGLRAAELAGLNWGDLQEKGDKGLIVVHGKRNKTRSVVLPVSVWQEVTALREEASKDEPVFASYKWHRSASRGGHLKPQQIWHIVKDAAERAGLGTDVSPHWLRHAHISHSLDRNVPVHLVQASVGHSSLATTGRYAHARPDESSALYLVDAPGDGTNSTTAQPARARYHVVERDVVLPMVQPLTPDTLKWTREHIGLSVYALAEHLGLDFQTVKDYEEGKLRRLRARAANLLREWLESVHAGQEAIPPIPTIDGVAFRRARLKAGITQQELAAQLGIDDDTISFVETGKHLTSPRVAIILESWLAEASKTPVVDGAAIREARQARGIGKRKLANAVGINVATLSRVEAGTYSPVGRVANLLRQWLESMQDRA